MAGFEDDGDTLKVSVRKLKSGSKYGKIIVQETECSVSNLTPALWSSLRDLKKDDKLKAVKKNGSFYFSLIQDADFPTKYNPSTDKWDTDSKPLKSIIFDLKVTPPSTVDDVDSNTGSPLPMTQPLASLKLEEVNEKAPSVPSSVVATSVETVEWFGKKLVLTAEQLEKGFQEGKLVTNHGTFSVGSGSPYASNLFCMLRNNHLKFAADESEGQFNFFHMESGPERKYNPEIKALELDYKNLTPEMEVLNLVVQKISD